MNTIEISITRFGDVKHACKAVITVVFNRNPSHPRTLNDWPEKKVRLKPSRRASNELERLFGCDMDGRVIWHAEDAMISVKVFV